MLSDWSPETCIVLSVEVAHGCSDLIYSGTLVNISVPFLHSLRLSLPSAFVSTSSSCVSSFFLSPLPLIPALSVYFVGVPSLSVCSPTARGAFISHGTDKSVFPVRVRAYVSVGAVCSHIHMHAHIFKPCFPPALMSSCSLALFAL